MSKNPVFAAVALALLGCPPATEPPGDEFPFPALPPRVRLALADDTLAPGAKPALSWTVSNEAAGHDLYLRVRAPGEPYSGAGGEFDTGAAPPTGEVKFLKADGTWSADAVAFGPAATGGAAPDLPSAGEGAWAFDAELRERASGATVSRSRRTALVSGRPAIYLSVNRPIAQGEDAVTADLLTTAGAEPKEVMIFAWLSPPSGPQRALPGLASAARGPVYEGPSSDDSIRLLSAPLGDLGAGVHRLNVRLVERATGKLLASAGAAVSVCDEPATLSGTVRDSKSAPVDGAADPLASARALDLDDGAIVEAPIGAGGAYTLTLPPGRYLAFARAGGSVALGDGPVVLGCGGASATLDLGLPAPGGLTARRKKRPAFGTTEQAFAPSNPASDGLPPPNVHFKWQNGLDGSAMGDPGLVSTLAGYFGGRVDSDSRDVNVVDDQMLRALANHLTLILQTGGDGTAETAGLENAAAAEFLIQFGYRKVGEKATLSMRLLDTTTGVAKAAKESRDIDAADQDRQREVVEALAAELTAYTSCSPGDRAARLCFWRLLDGFREKPIFPHVEVTLDREQLPVGEHPQATVSVTEKSTRAPAADKEVTLEYVYFVEPRRTDTSTVTTSALGTATIAVPSPATPGVAWVKATYRNRRGVEFTGSAYARWSAPSDVSLDSDRTALKTSEQATVTVQVPATGAPQEVEVSATLGATDSERVTVDAQGEGLFVFTAGTAGGVAEVTARSGADEASVPFFIQPRATIALRADAPTPVLDGTESPLVADVWVDNAALAGHPVRFRLADPHAGALTTTSTVTDESGIARTRYRAPATGDGADTVHATLRFDDTDYAASVTVPYREPCDDCPVEIVPFGAEVAKGGTVSFTANQAVDWSVNGGGTIQGGTFTAEQQGGNFTVTAASRRNASNKDSARVIVSCEQADFVGNYSGPQTFTTGPAAGCTAAPDAMLSVEAVPLSDGLGPNLLKVLYDSGTGDNCVSPHVGIRSVSCSFYAIVTHPTNLCTWNDFRLAVALDAVGMNKLVGSHTFRDSFDCTLVEASTFTVTRASP